METTAKKILVVEDEKNIAEVIKAYLEKEGYEVKNANNGKNAVEVFESDIIDFIILDLMLPDLSGEEICKKIRVKSDVPIIMLTAKVEEADRVNGLDIGADDYVTKPFSPKELVARVKAILRRTEGKNIRAEIITYNNGDLVIDTDKMEAKKQDNILKLTPTEFKVLSKLAQNPGKVFSREELIEKVLGFDYDGFDRTIDTHIKNIRQKIEDNDNKYISTVYGIGYKFVGD